MQNGVYMYTQRYTHTKHTSRLSLCFQLPDGPRGNQNFDTPGWKNRAGKPGCAGGIDGREAVHGAADTAQPRLSSDKPRCRENVETWHWGEGKNLCSSVHSCVFFFFSRGLKRGEHVWEGLLNYFLLFHEAIHCCSQGYFPVVGFGLCSIFITDRIPLKSRLMTPRPHTHRQTCWMSLSFLKGSNATWPLVLTGTGFS